jgi:APA family basic amino acid/polyamine antiporter
VHDPAISKRQNVGESPQPATHLERGLGLPQAVALNMLDMIGVGPFITLPLVVMAMGGPQAMLGWVLGALLAVCDGLVWAELGAAMPQAGGSYVFLREIYGTVFGQRAGRGVSFLYVWQLALSAPLSIASGCIGLAQYAAYLWPALHRPLFAAKFAARILPAWLPLQVDRAALLAVAACWLAVILLHRSIRGAGRISLLLWLGVLAALGWILFAGATHFHPALAFAFPPGAFHLSPKFFLGLGAATLLATYDYWGYYNVCFLGGEVRHPQRNIPRAVLLSIGCIAALYLAMNLSVLGVVPWQEIAGGKSASLSTSVIAVFIARLYGSTAGRWMAVLILWTAFASIFSLLLGYSRVFYAAAADGNFFSRFARLHPRYRIPHVALLWLGAVASLACFFRLVDVIAALVVVRLLLQFLLQQIGLLLLRRRRPEMFASFRMKLYPLPVWIAIAGSLFMLVARHGSGQQMLLAAAIAFAGVGIFALRRARGAKAPAAPGRWKRL